MGGAADRGVDHIGGIVKVGQLIVELVHDVRSHCRVGRADLHVDSALLQVAHAVDLVSAPGLHVFVWDGDGGCLIIHTQVVLCSCIPGQYSESPCQLESGDPRIDSGHNRMVHRRRCQSPS